MDLTFLIICIILIYLIYYLVNCVQSLNNELKEVKEKCINTKNNETFNVNTPDVKEKLTENTISTLEFMKKFFSK
tara:strand:+ start:685 stop:909 length:225 start_codon:yes stop_codon:yes gene_type:complete